ncbi:hypothetical protein MSAN_02295500 [Mycena sanguinolenta]|uniref:Uncharacterized protein n=1 Tax=Mycena sanguinolenta TaxID=230812 RepID=A0A8H7CGF1_9AGAR|nr:hypothetical protein MSAN_02295500 [Mycena sanguinolenta]
MPHRLSALHTLTRPRLHQQAKQRRSPYERPASTLNDRGAVSTPSGRRRTPRPHTTRRTPRPARTRYAAGGYMYAPATLPGHHPSYAPQPFPHHAWRLCPVSVARHDPQPADAPVRRDWWRRWWRRDPDGAHGRRGDEAQRSRAEKMLTTETTNAASLNAPIRAPAQNNSRTSAAPSPPSLCAPGPRKDSSSHHTHNPRPLRTLLLPLPPHPANSSPNPNTSYPSPPATNGSAPPPANGAASISHPGTPNPNQSQGSNGVQANGKSPKLPGIDSLRPASRDGRREKDGKYERRERSPE